jgi:hypothetical protein
MSVVALVWEALDYCCAERLHPRLLPVAEQLNRHHVPVSTENGATVFIEKESRHA